MRRGKPLSLESQSKFIDQNEVIANISVTKCGFRPLEVIAGEEITESQHIAQVIGDLVSSDEINFRAVHAGDCVGNPRKGFVIGHGVRKRCRYVQLIGRPDTGSALKEPRIVHACVVKIKFL